MKDLAALLELGFDLAVKRNTGGSVPLCLSL